MTSLPAGGGTGDLLFLEFGLANEEHANVISVEMVDQPSTAIVTKNHPAGSSIRPSIWPTAVLLRVQRFGVRYQRRPFAQRWLRSDGGGPGATAP